MKKTGDTIRFNPALVEVGTVRPTWGDVGSVVIRLMLTGDTQALNHMTADIARAFAAAEALHKIQAQLPDDLNEIACSVVVAELAKQGINPKQTTDKECK